MKILLFGTVGQLGWELSRSLPVLGEVYGVDFPQIDLSDYKNVGGFIKQLRPDLVINATAYTNVDKAEVEVEKAEAINWLAVREMAKVTAELKAGLIHFSTDYVYDGTKDSPYLESDPTNPLNRYGLSKLKGEQAIQEEAGLYWIFRTSWVYSTRVGGFVNKVLEWARKNPELKVVSDQISNPTWCRVLADAVTLAAASGRKDLSAWMQETSGIYHVAGNGSASRYDWAKEIVACDPHKEQHVFKTFLPAKSDEFPLPAQRPLETRLDCSRFMKTFGLNLPDWKDSLKLALA